MGIRLRARVRQILHPPVNGIGTIVDGRPVMTARLPNPHWLEIAEEDGAFFMYYLNAELECFADTWHASLQDAQAAAEQAFGITHAEWSKVESLR